MSNKPTSISDLIDKFDTITAFASEVGCGYEAARQMRRRKKIAPEYWAKVVDVAKAKKIDGVTLEWLAQQRAASSENAA